MLCYFLNDRKPEIGLLKLTAHAENMQMTKKKSHLVQLTSYATRMTAQNAKCTN